MNASNHPLVIATHSGSHHADDVFGVAILMGLHPDATLVRTRDPEIIATADFTVDVGGEWDPVRGRFDHHQRGFDGKRPDSGVTYASAGLVWAAQGKAFLALIDGTTEAEIDWLHKVIDDELVQHLDMADTGAAQGAEGFFGLSALLSSFNLTRIESEGLIATFGANVAFDKSIVAEFRQRRFVSAMETVRTLLERIAVTKLDEYRGNALVRAGARHEEGKVLVLEHPALTWESVVCNEMPDVQFVIYPDSTDGQYQVRTVPVAVGSFKARMDLPKAWAGLRDATLAEASGVPDAVFCHNARFIGGAVSLEGALKMAQLALANPTE